MSSSRLTLWACRGRAPEGERYLPLASPAPRRLQEAESVAAPLAVVPAGAGQGAALHRRRVQLRAQPHRAFLYLRVGLALAIGELQGAAPAPGPRQGGGRMKRARAEAKRTSIWRQRRSSLGACTRRSRFSEVRVEQRRRSCSESDVRSGIVWRMRGPTRREVRSVGSRPTRRNAQSPM